jgi:hypothetical protein
MTRFFAAIFIIAGAFCFSVPAFAERRIALVIGNSAYAVGPLKNPGNDADDVADALKRLRFEVVMGKDLTIRAFDDTIEDFVARAKDADIALFFFAGHGVQIDKRGFLAPVDMRAETVNSALRELVAIQEVVSRIENAARVSIIVLDACRDSPLQERLRRSAVQTNRMINLDKGLPQISGVGSNTLVVYSTVPGETASDGTGKRNSPFTAALLKHIETPSLEVELMFKRVTADVLKDTGGLQQPERLSRLQSELILLMDTAEIQLWDSVKDSKNPDDIDKYLAKYPSGKFSAVAHALKMQLEQQALLDQALKEETKRRAEAERREAEVRRLEESLKAREAALAAEKRRLDGAGAAALKTEGERKQVEGKLAEEERQLEALKYSEELRRAKEEARSASEAAEASEKRRQAAEKTAAEAHRKAAETGKHNVSRPGNLSAYSLQFWPRNSLSYKGQTVSTQTPHGRLTCTSMGRDTPRACSLR